MEIKSQTNGTGSELSAESAVIDKPELCIDHLQFITCLFFIHMEAVVDKCADSEQNGFMGKMHLLCYSVWEGPHSSSPDVEHCC